MRTLIIIFFLFIFSSCEDGFWFLKDDGIPDCIKKEIRDFKKKEVCDSGASVTKLEFQDQIVFAFYDGPCIIDGSSFILNSDCELICTLGTIAGITDCNDEPFSNAIELEVLWEQ